MKKFFMILMVVFLALSTSIISSAQVSDEMQPSVILYKLGLFNGTGVDSEGNPIFALENKLTRQEATTLLVRLLGKEDEALAEDWNLPFDDVDLWAKPYVGYAYNHGIVKGISEVKFGATTAISATEYLTLILRSLGYNDKEGDFAWDSAWTLSDNLKITEGQYTNSTNADFCRKDSAYVSYRSLFQKIKGQEQTLANKLLWDDVFSTDQLDKTHDGKLMIAADMPNIISNGVYVYNLEDLYDLIILSYRNFQLGIAINCPGYTYEELLEVFEKTKRDQIFHDQIYSYPSCSGWNGYIIPHVSVDTPVMMQLYYENPERYEKNYKIYREDLWYDEEEFKLGIYDLHAWIENINSIINNIIQPDMTETQKVKAIYDYICKHTTYDSGYEKGAFMTPHFASKVIFDGHGVCDGYASAFKILCNAVGIECIIPRGFSSNSGHAWNQAKIDGQWYNFDVCWGDTKYKNRISYDYFGKSDAAFSKDGHQKYGLVVPVYECDKNLSW